MDTAVLLCACFTYFVKNKARILRTRSEIAIMPYGFYKFMELGFMSKTEETAEEITEITAETAEHNEKTKYIREGTRWKVIRVLLSIVIGLFVIAGRSAQWANEEWGDLTFDEVMFTLTQPLNGTDSGIIRSYILYAVVPAILVLVVLFLIYRIFLDPKQPPKGRKIRGDDGKKVLVPNK